MTGIPQFPGQLTDAEIDVLHSLGVLPVDAAQARAEREAAERSGEGYDPLVGALLTPEQAVARLEGIDTAEQLESLRASGHVLGLEVAGASGTINYPAWGIQRGAALEGLAAVLAELLPHWGAWSASKWLRTPAAALEGRTPADALADGRDVDVVVRAAERQAVEWGRATADRRSDGRVS